MNDEIDELKKVVDEQALAVLGGEMKARKDKVLF